ncbi:hypothetical protein [Streptomyces sp. NPDC093970]
MQLNDTAGLQRGRLTALALRAEQTADRIRTKPGPSATHPPAS